MKKAFDQTVRDIKREVNKKVLKVPGIEQKVLDATSNEPWGPHGSLLADIAQATRNYHEYQMIMGVIWKRINDTGKNWRHVYKALTVLEYLVAHGSERITDEIKEHAYQISTLSGFQYIDSSGRDQGNNVRKKSQNLVSLVNDKERLHEVRLKATVSRDKFRSASSSSGMYRPNPYSSTGVYGDRYDDDHYEGHYGSRDEDRNGYGREREWGSKDDDRYGRYGDSYARYGDNYNREFDERYGKDSFPNDDCRGRSRTIDDYQYGSRSRSSDRDKHLAYDDDGDYSSRGSGVRADDSSQDGRRFERKLSEQNLGAPPSYDEAIRSPAHNERATSAPKAASPSVSTSPSQPVSGLGNPASTLNQTNHGADNFDEFDPRGSVPAAAPAEKSGEMDLFGSLSESSSSNALAIITDASQGDAPAASAPGPTLLSQPFAENQQIEDPFGDGPFKAFPTTDGAPAGPFVPPKTENVPNFTDTFPGITYSAPQPSPTNAQFLPHEMSNLHQETDILADILPPSGPSQPLNPEPSFSSPTGLEVFGGNAPYPTSGSGSFQPVLPGSMTSGGPAAQNNNSVLGILPQVAPAPPPISQSLVPFTGPLAEVPQPSKEKFEPKSAIWADTLSRGLVNLNISGSKTNPLADIGIDFEAINRKEKRMEKPSVLPVTSNISMGKAMGSGSGMGRAGVGSMRPPPNPTTNYSNMGMGMRGYGGMNQQPIGMVGMNMGMGQGVPQDGLPPGASMTNSYNPIMGTGGYSPQPYGGRHP